MKNLSTIPRMQCLFATVLLFSLMSATSFAQTVLFRDDFNGTTLNTSLWSVVDGGSAIQVTSGFLQTAGGPDHKRIDSSPAFAPMGESVIARAQIRLAGDYQKFGFRVNPTEFAGPISGYYFDTFSRSGDIGQEHHVYAVAWSIPISGPPINLLQTLVSVTWYEFHEFVIERTSSEVIFLIDGQEVARVSDTFGSALPVGVWNDRPDLMLTDWVEVNLPPVCVNPPSGLVSWWPGDGNANDIKDGNNGTLVNGATFAAGKVGQAFSFDGVDDAALIADNASLQVSSFTLDAWINTADATLQQPIIAKAQASGNWDSYMLRIQDGGKLALIVENRAETRSVHWRTLSTLSSNRWYHVAGTWQNLNGDNTDAKIYVDGVEQAIEISFNNGYSSTFLPGYTTEPLFIGRDEYPSGYFKGDIDEVDIYDRVLSASEIQSIYNAGSAGKCKECTPPDVSITGNESVCPNTTHTYAANTDAANPSFEWSVTGGTINGNTGSSISVTAGDAGTMIVSVEVTDGVTNCSKSVTQNVTVEDNQAPVITATTNPITLWPPNHQYVTINVSQCVTAVTDNCAALSVNNVIITKVTSDEPEDAKGGGDGNTLNDIVIAANCQSVQLRSERQGSGNGRVYTLHLSVNDGNGNIGAATCLVTVPKSQNGNPAVNDGLVYTVGSSCGSGTSKLSQQDFTQETLPESYALEQNYPNPFWSEATSRFAGNPSTVINFQLPVNSEVKLAIYSLTGQLVRELVNGEMNAGRHAISWDGRDRIGNTVAAGMYLYRLVALGENGEVVFTQTRRMALVK